LQSLKSRQRNFHAGPVATPVPDRTRKTTIISVFASAENWCLRCSLTERKWRNSYHARNQLSARLRANAWGLVSPYLKGTAKIKKQIGMRRLQILLLLLIFWSATAFARIGETSLQFIDRYGAPKDTSSSKILDKNSPLLEGTVHVYEYQGWKILSSRRTYVSHV
jgi:hypothetical protein